MDEFFGSIIAGGVGLVIGYSSLGLSNWIRAKQGKDPVDVFPGLNSHGFAVFFGLIMAIAFYFMQ